MPAGPPTQLLPQMGKWANLTLKRNPGVACLVSCPICEKVLSSKTNWDVTRRKPSLQQFLLDGVSGVWRPAAATVGLSLPHTLPGSTLPVQVGAVRLSDCQTIHPAPTTRVLLPVQLIAGDSCWRDQFKRSKQTTERPYKSTNKQKITTKSINNH